MHSTQGGSLQDAAHKFMHVKATRPAAASHTALLAHLHRDAQQVGAHVLHAQRQHDLVYAILNYMQLTTRVQQAGLGVSRVHVWLQEALSAAQHDLIHAVLNDMQLAAGIQQTGLGGGCRNAYWR